METHQPRLLLPDGELQRVKANGRTGAHITRIQVLTEKFESSFL